MSIYGRALQCSQNSKQYLQFSTVLQQFSSTVFQYSTAVRSVFSCCSCSFLLVFGQFSP